MEVTAYDLAQRFVGISEVPGSVSNPHILAMLRLDSAWAEDDWVPWCSAFVNYVCWLLRLPRSRSLAARSWLTVGTVISIDEADIGYDIVILSRGPSPQPGPETLAAPGHVGFFAGDDGDRIWILGGNQDNMVSVAPFPTDRILGVRRLA